MTTKVQTIVEKDIIKNTENNLILEQTDIDQTVNSDNEYENNEYENKYIEKNNNYLVFSSDEDEDIENKISLKKKKIKYTGKKAKMIRSIKDGNENKNRKVK